MKRRREIREFSIVWWILVIFTSVLVVGMLLTALWLVG